MTSAKTTTTKKATKKADVDADATTKFDEFRERAIAINGGPSKVTISNEPYIIGTEQGFSRDMELTKPSFRTRLAIDAAVETGSIIRLIQLVFGEHVDAVIDDLDKFEDETGEPASDVLTGLTVAYLEHFFGQGAAGQVFTKLSI